jgi:hypothetical protein
MTIIVEDGTGVANANSYASVAEAEAYFNLKGRTVAVTEEALINATQFLDLSYGEQYLGYKKDKNQELDWPRTAFYNHDRFLVTTGTMPKELKIALYETASLAIAGTDLFSDVPLEDANLKSITNTVEGAVSQSKEYFTPTRTSEKASIGKYLYKILKPSAGQSVRIK